MVNPNPVTPPANTPALASASDSLEARLVAFMDKVEGKFTLLGQDMGKLRDRIGKGSDSPASAPAANGATQTAPAGLTAADLMAAMNLGALRAGLTKAQQEALDGQIAGGRSFVDALAFAEFAKLGAQAPASNASGATPAVAPPTQGVASTHLPTQPDQPADLASLFEIKAKDPVRYKAIMDDPSFDPSALQYRVKR